MRSKLIFFILFSLVTINGNSQESLNLEKWTVGGSVGYHTNSMRFPALNKELYPRKANSHSAVFSLFAEYPFYKQFSARAEMAFLGRGGELRMSGLPSAASGLYRVNTTYMDLRFPVIYNFNLPASKLMPYVYLAPEVGFALAGKLYMQTRSSGGKVYDYNLSLTRANMAIAQLAVDVGVGAKYPIELAGKTFFLGLEAGYDLGLTDTYSKKEKSGESISINGVNKDVAGVRKNMGFEMKIAAFVPLSIFKKKAPVKVVVKPVLVEHVYIPPPVVEIEKACYSVDEILEMINEGKSVVGKTICAIDAVNFDTGKYDIKPSFMQYLDRLATILIETDISVEVGGHTDSVGEKEFNVRLSKDRAVAVVKYLVGKGVSKDRITYTYHGMSKPLTTNDTEEGRRLNRRVEFKLQ